MTDNQNIRNTVKVLLRNRDYKKAIEYLSNYAENDKVKHKISNNLSEYNNLESRFNTSQIDNQSYFYAVNKFVVNILEITDEIVGVKDDDWDFIDEMSSNLKFNLVEESQQMQTEINQMIDKELFLDLNETSAKQLDFSKVKEQEKNLKDVIRKLSYLMHKYEELKLSAKTKEEEKKYHDIIEGINSQVVNYTQKLKQLIPEN